MNLQDKHRFQAFQKVLQMFAIVESILNKKLIFVISILSSIEL